MSNNTGPNTSASYIEDVEKFAEILSQDEKRDEERLKEEYKRRAIEAIENAFNPQPYARKTYHNVTHYVPLWMFLTLGVITLIATSALAFVLGSGFPEGALVLPTTEQMEQPLLNGQ